MIPKECKRLAEVDFPIATVSRHAAREKSIRHGHPSTLHLWWARRPLAACRAMLLGLLLPDPADPHCPEQFKIEARKLLAPLPVALEPDDDGLRRAILKFIGDFSNWDLSNNNLYVETARSLIKAAHGDEMPLVVDPFAGGGSIPLEALRLGCDTFASDLNPVACLILKVMLEDIPRHGPKLAEELRRVGSEIKEKAEKELAEFYPKYPLINSNFESGSYALFKKKDNSFEYIRVGDVKKHLFESQKHYTHYLPIAKGAEHALNFGFTFYDWDSLEKQGIKPFDLKWETPIAYLWARTVQCESPDCGAEIPLMRSFWLCKKTNRKRALKYKVISPKDGIPLVEFEIFEPENDNQVPNGTVSRARATCLCCGKVLPPDRVRAQLSAQQGGADVVFNTKGDRISGARLLAVVTLKPNEQGRHYRLLTEHDYEVVWKAQKRFKAILDEWELGSNKGLCPIPDEPTPAGGGSGAGRAFSVQKYGMMKFGDLFTARQKVVLIRLRDLVAETDSDDAAIKRLLACAFSRVAMSDMQCTRWNAVAEKMQHTFGRQALPIVWDFAEIVPTADAPGNWRSGYDLVADVLEFWPPNSSVGQTQIADAVEFPGISESVSVWFTDPPYYDAIPYANLSDFFLVWLKRTLLGNPLLRDPFDPQNTLTPKTREVVQDETEEKDGKTKDRAFFEKTMAKAFAEGRRVLKEDGVGTVVFAHKTTEGWEALLSGMIQGGWTITGSWPIATEMGSRLRARDSAALATSVHLVCRPRPEDAPAGDWADVLRELPNRVGNWMERLQKEGIRGADLVFACIGPALEIYSRYAKVVDAQDREIPLGGDPMATEPHKRGYLAYVWEAVGKAALEQVLGTAEPKAQKSTAEALEEDSRLTALFLWTLQSTNGNGEKNAKEEDTASREKKGGFNLVFDVVRRFAQPLGIILPDWEGRIIETKKGIVKLLTVKERAKQLFGDQGTRVVADELETSSTKDLQLKLFPEGFEDMAPEIRGQGRKRTRRGSVEISDDALKARREATTLDRVHAAMLLQASGRANALRALLKAETDRGPDFLRLANALSALYPRWSEEKRLVDAMLLAVPR